MKHVYIVGTADTKGPELTYLKTLVQAAGASALLVDVGTRAANAKPDVSAERVAACHPRGAKHVLSISDRGAAVEAMGEAFGHFIVSRDDIGGVLGIGGGGGTSIVTAGLRRLPVGVPKLVLSTLAAGDVKPFVGASDITMMYSVTDVSGLNSISRVVPLKRMLSPTSVPITHSVLDGHVLQTRKPRMSVTIPSSKNQTAPGPERCWKKRIISITPSISR